jgi:hypothetical protein
MTCVCVCVGSFAINEFKSHWLNNRPVIGEMVNMCMHVCLCTCQCFWVDAHYMFVHMHWCVCVHVPTTLHICFYICTCIYIYMCIYVHLHCEYLHPMITAYQWHNNVCESARTNCNSVFLRLSACSPTQYKCPGSDVCQDTVTWCDQVPNCPLDADEQPGCRKYSNTRP